ncbi:UNVERIFIED_CONTAM: hypothetical protein HDU68_001318 [Siphonaria sp. JEL0065]|nr:hypothetical protein HDU68_001318 [Siphonaria sp. JEL0065]
MENELPQGSTEQQLASSCCNSTPMLSDNKDCDLQNQIASLKKKVSELEATHKASLEKVQREKTNLAQDLLKKNQIIDKMRIKLNRYEFSLKEAILFLTKPMDAYEVWLNNKNLESNNTMVVTAIQGAIGAANGVYAAGPSYLNGNTGATTPQQVSTPTAPPSRSRNPSTTPVIKSKLHSNSASSLAIVTSDSASQLPIVPIPQPKIGGATNLEIHCMECMRLSLNYLKNAQSSINSMEKDDVIPYQVPTAPAPLLPDPLLLLNITPLDEALRNLKTSIIISSDGNSNLNTKRSSVTSSNRTSSIAPPPLSPVPSPSQPHPAQPMSAVAKSRALALARLNSPERRQSALITNTALLRAATITSPTDDGSIDDGDISSKHTVSTSSSNSNNTHNAISSQPAPEKTGARTCLHCREYMIQIDQYNDTIETLRGDIRTLANQLEEERAMRDRNQLAKDILDQELEELTSQLFDQANKMVIDEARMRDELEVSNRDLKGELKELIGRCEKREEELKELNRNLKALEAAKLRSSVLSVNGTNSQHGSIASLSPTSTTPTSNLFPKGPSSHAYYSTMSIIQLSRTPLSIPVDGILLSEFQDHIRQAISAITSPTNPNPAPATTANETHFIKRCILEDVEPCLFSQYPTLTQGPGGILSTSKLPKTLSFTNGGLVTLKKRLLEGFLRGQVEVYSIVDQDAQQQQQQQQQQTSSTHMSSPNTPNPHHIQKSKCTSCLHPRECEFKLRLTDKLPPDTYPLCTFCKDRVSTVSDFYTYMGHLRQGIIGPGKQGVTLIGMLRHAMWLRRRMSVARVGNCGLFEVEGLVAADRRGDSVGDWEKFVSIVH